jgi:hypothetical protein
MIPYLISPRFDGLYRRFGAAFFGLAIFLVFVAAGSLYLDPDFGWHLMAGDYIRAHGVPAHDIFTYTARNFPWIDHEWLNDVIVSWLYGSVGYLGLGVIFGAIWTAAVVLAGRSRNWLLLFLAAMAMLPYAGIRPISWTVLFLVILERILSAKNKKLLWLTPPLFLLWANLHGGFLVGLAVVAAEASPRVRSELTLVFVSGILVSFINPYGPRLYVELFRTLGDASLRYRVQEWEPFYFALPTLLFICYTVALYWFGERRKVKGVVSIPGALLVAALLSSRNAPLFVVASIRKLEEYLGGLRAALPSRPGKKERRLLLALLAVPVLLSAYSLYSFFWPSGGGVSYPQQEVAYLKAHPCTGNLFNDYDFGGYLIWQLPGRPVYIDGRMPSWRYRGTDYYADFQRIYTDPAFLKEQFGRYDIRCALIETETIAPKDPVLGLLAERSRKTPSLEAELLREGWRVRSRGPGTALLER